MNKLMVTIVIPNWNGKTLLEKHLKVIVAASNSAEIIVVDDGSTDDSVAFLQKKYPKIKVIEKKMHEGYAGTVNAGVLAARGEIVVLLNTDIEPEKDYLKPLLIHFIDNKVFAVGCMDKSYEKNQVILRGRGVGWWEKGFYIHKRGEIDQTDTAWVSGGSGAFKKSIWMELGGMDTRFNPFYWEDIDISYRATQKGYKLLFEPKSVVHHYHEEGSIKNQYSKNEILNLAYRNQFIFQRKNMPNVRQWILYAFWLPIRILQNLAGRNTAMIKGFLLSLIK